MNTFNTELKNYAQSHDYVFLDVDERIRGVLDGKEISVNLTDLSNPCHDGVNCVEQGDSPGLYHDKRCEGKMFFDRVHPTTLAHCSIANWIEQALATQYEVNGATHSLQSCASRIQTEKASWGFPVNHSEQRSRKFKVKTSLNPTDFECQIGCFDVGQASWNDEKGNITLPNDTTVGFCTCEGGSGSFRRYLHDASKNESRGGGFAWSNGGDVDDMVCTQIREPSDPHTWTDNYLCVPQNSAYHFTWSSAGPVIGLDCIQWAEPSDPHTWQDNWLCWEPPGSACVHSPLTTGSALTDGCSECVTSICTADPWCCTNSWDTQCVSAAENDQLCTES